MKRTIVEGWRSLALGILLLGLAGTCVELLLLEHIEDRNQWIPVVLLGTGFLTGLLLAVRPSRGSLRVFGFLMGVYLPAAALGIYFHLKSNVEFELEMRPTMTGLELVRESLQGAMPALAPGALAYLGLLGLLVWYRHPAGRTG